MKRTIRIRSILEDRIIDRSYIINDDNNAGDVAGCTRYIARFGINKLSGNSVHLYSADSKDDNSNTKVQDLGNILHYAAKFGDISFLETVVSVLKTTHRFTIGNFIKLKTSAGYTAIECAGQAGRDCLFQPLIKYGATPKEAEIFGYLTTSKQMPDIELMDLCHTLKKRFLSSNLFAPNILPDTNLCKNIIEAIPCGASIDFSSSQNFEHQKAYSNMCMTSYKIDQHGYFLQNSEICMQEIKEDYIKTSGALNECDYYYG